LLTGLGLTLCNPITLIPLALILVTSQFLASRLSRLSAAAVVFVDVTGVLIGAFWVPNPIVLWPFEIFGGPPTLRELIDNLFPIHIVPASAISLDSPGGFEAMIRWPFIEWGARFCVLIVVWVACLLAIRTAEKRLCMVKRHCDE
jgi:hypothetical protein